jgi:hypothetical protein
MIKDHTVVIPPLGILDEKDLLEIVEGYSKQALSTKSSSTFFALSEYEKRKIMLDRPASLTELKQHITSLIMDKNRPSVTQEPIKFDHTFTMVDETLVHAARLGKNALKDRHMVAILWHKFEKNQNKIAAFLGVNRSSVNRRIKAFNLT